MQAELAEMEQALEQAGTEHDDDAGARIAGLESELAEIERQSEREADLQVAELEAARDSQALQAAALAEQVDAARRAREQADREADELRRALAETERRAQDARREAASVGAELAAANQFLRSHARFGGDEPGSTRALSDELSVADGYELALAAALGGRLDAALVGDVAGAEQLLDRAGPDGGAALLAADGAGAGPSSAGSGPAGAERLLDLLSGPPPVMALASRLLADAWVVEKLEGLPGDFRGVAVTRSGRVLFASWGEVRQVSEGGSERVLARRNERDRLIAASESAAQDEHRARGEVEGALERVRSAGTGAHRRRDRAARGRAQPRRGAGARAPDRAG